MKKKKNISSSHRHDPETDGPTIEPVFSYSDRTAGSPRLVTLQDALDRYNEAHRVRELLVVFFSLFVFLPSVFVCFFKLGNGNMRKFRHEFGPWRYVTHDCLYAGNGSYATLSFHVHIITRYTLQTILTAGIRHMGMHVRAAEYGQSHHI